MVHIIAIIKTSAVLATLGLLVFLVVFGIHRGVQPYTPPSPHPLFTSPTPVRTN